MLKRGIFWTFGIERFINPYWQQTHREIQRNLNLVRKINPTLFDKQFSLINFAYAKLQTNPIN